MAQVKIYYEPEMELLTVFWQPPRKNQIAIELGDGVILIKDETTGEPIGMELLSYHPSDNRFDAVSVEMGRAGRNLIIASSPATTTSPPKNSTTSSTMSSTVIGW